MSRLLPFAVAFAGLVMVALLLEAGKARIAGVEEPQKTIDRAMADPSDAGPDEQTAVAGPARPVRAVQPEAFVPPFGRQTSGLERLPARPPLAAPKPKKKVEGVLLVRPSVEAPGVLSFPQGRVILAGIRSMPVAQTCSANGDSVWPCGMMALAALRRFIRGRAVFCRISDPDWHGSLATRCDLGNQDVAAWLAQNGWAEGNPGTPYAELSAEAQAGKKGIFGDDPRAHD